MLKSTEDRFKLKQEELEKSISALKIMRGALEEKLHDSEAQAKVSIMVD